MRALLVCLTALGLGGCQREACDGVDGTCVSLTVDGPGEIDALLISLSGAARGTHVAPLISKTATLPVAVALQLPNQPTGTLHIAVEGVRLGARVGDGTTDVLLGDHVAATVVLDRNADAGVSLPRPDLGGGCGDGAAPCAGACCAIGQICSGTQCVYPSAQLYLYMCPSFNKGCSATGFLMNGICVSAAGAVAGSCFLSPFNVAPNRTYSISVCQSCPGNCSTATPFTTPAVFTQPTYYPDVFFYCQTQCIAPSSCP